MKKWQWITSASNLTVLMRHLKSMELLTRKYVKKFVQTISLTRVISSTQDGLSIKVSAFTHSCALLNVFKTRMKT